MKNETRVMKPKELTIRSLILGSLITTDLHGGQCLPWTQGRPYLRIVHSGGGNLDGHPESREGLVDPRKQHRPDRGVCRRHTLSDHLCSSGTGDRRLVDGISFLAIVSDLPEWRRARSVVHDPTPTRAGYELRPALPGRRRGGRGVESRFRHARRNKGRDGRSKRRAHRCDLGSVASAGLAILTATRIAAAEVTGFFRLGSGGIDGYDIAWSLALVGAGHLVGLSVGMAMLTGLVIAWAIAVPILTSMQPAAEGVDLAAHTTTIWRTQVRFIGAGAIAVAAIYTLAKLAKPVVGGLVSTLASFSRRGHTETISTAIFRPRGFSRLRLLVSSSLDGWLSRLPDRRCSRQTR